MRILWASAASGRFLAYWTKAGQGGLWAISFRDEGTESHPGHRALVICTGYGTSEGAQGTRGQLTVALKQWAEPGLAYRSDRIVYPWGRAGA